MSSARKFIAKCRRRGYDGDRIRDAANGKSATLRDEVLRMLAQNPNLAESDREIPEVFAAATETLPDNFLAGSASDAEKISAARNEDRDPDDRGETVSASASEPADASASVDESAVISAFAGVDALVGDAEISELDAEIIDDFPPCDAEFQSEKSLRWLAPPKTSETPAAPFAGETADLPNELIAVANIDAKLDSHFFISETVAEIGAESEIDMQIADNHAEILTASDVAPSGETAEIGKAETAEIVEESPEIIDDNSAEIPGAAIDAPNALTVAIALEADDDNAADLDTLRENLLEIYRAANAAPVDIPDDIAISIDEEITLPENWFAVISALGAPSAAVEKVEKIAVAASETAQKPVAAQKTGAAKTAPADNGNLDANAVAPNEKTPQLTVVKTRKPRKSARENSGKELKFIRPAYAITREETTRRLAENFTEETVAVPAITADFSADEHWRAACEDFDDCARPAIFTETGETLADWQTALRARVIIGKKLERQIVELRQKLADHKNLLANREYAITALAAEQESAAAREKVAHGSIARLQRTLAETREVYANLLADNEREAAELTAIRAGVKNHEKICSAQADAIGNLQTRLAEKDCELALAEIARDDWRAQLAQHAETIANLRYENAQYEREIVKLGTQQQFICAVLGEQAETLRRWQERCETAVADAAKLAAHNRDLRQAQIAHQQTAAAQAEKLAAQQTRLQTLIDENRATRIELGAQESSIHVLQRQLDAANTAAETLAEKCGELERDCNALASETIPNLQKDKEDLVALIGEEIARGEDLEERLLAKSRRSSYAIVIAAAACVAIAALPFFSAKHWEQRERKMTAEYDQQIRALTDDRDSRIAENSEWRERAQLFEESARKVAAERQTWRHKAINLQNELRDNHAEISRLRAVATETAQISARETAADRDGDAPGDGFAAQGAHYNEIRGIDQWLDNSSNRAAIDPHARATRQPRELPARDNRGTDRAGLIELKTVEVRKGEGLSQLLWRVCGRSSPELVVKVARYNQLKVDGRGNPMLKVGQAIKVPAVISTAMLAE